MSTPPSCPRASAAAASSAAAAAAATPPAARRAHPGAGIIVSPISAPRRAHPVDEIPAVAQLRSESPGTHMASTVKSVPPADVFVALLMFLDPESRVFDVLMAHWSMVPEVAAKDFIKKIKKSSRKLRERLADIMARIANSIYLRRSRRGMAVQIDEFVAKHGISIPFKSPDVLDFIEDAYLILLKMEETRITRVRPSRPTFEWANVLVQYLRDMSNMIITVFSRRAPRLIRKHFFLSDRTLLGIVTRDSEATLIINQANPHRWMKMLLMFHRIHQAHGGARWFDHDLFDKPRARSPPRLRRPSSPQLARLEEAVETAVATAVDPIPVSLISESESAEEPEMSAADLLDFAASLHELQEMEFSGVPEVDIFAPLAFQDAPTTPATGLFGFFGESEPELRFQEIEGEWVIVPVTPPSAGGISTTPSPPPGEIPFSSPEELQEAEVASDLLPILVLDPGQTITALAREIARNDAPFGVSFVTRTAGPCKAVHAPEYSRKRIMGYFFEQFATAVEAPVFDVQRIRNISGELAEVYHIFFMADKTSLLIGDIMHMFEFVMASGVANMEQALQHRHFMLTLIIAAKAIMHTFDTVALVQEAWTIAVMEYRLHEEFHGTILLDAVCATFAFALDQRDVPEPAVIAQLMATASGVSAASATWAVVIIDRIIPAIRSVRASFAADRDAIQ